MMAAPNPATVAAVAFHLAEMTPDNQRDALGKLAVAIATGMVERFRWSPERSAEFTQAFVGAVVDRLPQMSAEQKVH